MRRRRPTPAAIAVVLAALVFLASVALPALGAPRAVTASGLANKVAKALGVAKQANTDSKRALKAAKVHGPGVAGEGGNPGLTGDPGDAGTPGTAGAPGAPGSSGGAGYDGIPRKATIHLADPPAESDHPEPEPVPLDAGNAWTQLANEVDLVMGTADVVDDGCMSNSSPSVTINVHLGSDATGPLLLTGLAFNDSTVVLRPPSDINGAPATIFEPGADTPRQLFVEALDTCDVGGTFALSDINLSVVGLR